LAPGPNGNPREAGPIDGPASATLHAQRISVFFEGLCAIREVTLSLNRGEILGLLGPNGAGKTTLINVITGMQRPNEGRIVLEGADMTGRAPHHRAKLGVTRTFQDLRLFRNLSVYENAEAGALAVGMGRAEVRTSTLNSLERFGLLEVSDMPAAALNHVLQRHLSLARALATRPRFLLLDEPGAGLSEEESDQLLEMLLSIRSSVQCGLLVVEHDMRLIMRLCDRIHVLNEGATIAVGEPSAVQNDASVIKAYLGA
jgi:branched-chain amino acid transport system ATP-binding protein